VRARAIADVFGLAVVAGRRALEVDARRTWIVGALSLNITLSLRVD
jgi:hypothetical protein